MLKGIALVLLLGLLGLAGLTAQPAVGSPSRDASVQRATGGTLTFTPEAPVAGDPGRFRVKVPTSGRRAVQLQRLAAGTWKLVASKSSTTAGVATFDITVPAKRTTYRAYAPRVASKNLAAVTTETLAVLPSLRGTVSQLGMGEYPSVSADGGEVVWSGYDDEGFNAAIFHRTDTGSTSVMSSPALDPVISGDGGSVLFRKGGQGFWDASWGLRRSNGTGEGTLVWQERADEEAPQHQVLPRRPVQRRWLRERRGVPDEEDVERLYVVTSQRQPVPRERGERRDRQDIAPDGSCVGFDTHQPLVPADTDGKVDAYVWVPATNNVELASRLPDGSASPRPSSDPSISLGCRFVTYEITGRYDLFGGVALGPADPEPPGCCPSGPAALSEGDNYDPSISADGSQVAFTSTAPLTLEKDQGGVRRLPVEPVGQRLDPPDPEKQRHRRGPQPRHLRRGRHVVFDWSRPAPVRRPATVASTVEPRRLSPPASPQRSRAT